MSKLLATLLLSVLVTSYSFSQEPIFKNGFDLEFNIAITGDGYSLQRDYVGKDNGTITIGFQLGNHWYVYRNNKLGIAIDVNWLDFAYGRKSKETSNLNFIEVALVEVGPLATYALTNDIAIEGYWNIRLTFLSTFKSDDWDIDALTDTANGITNAIGLGVKLKKYYVGLESTFGSVKDRRRAISRKLMLTQFRFIGGFKF
ncbi:hypothetical protein [Flammeovirga sp. EKP202]|uniref:hypothetical protein n=1 Tax=Flammeovirga sp. EKP202 TaxID=2770592 RepID=UPI00165EDD47|nr:hypothetical protein [Flammeovirga sp. EKP202]MBD0401343.1 hypothetical protein [Flammeovirga sp. EKP202]